MRLLLASACLAYLLGGAFLHAGDGKDGFISKEYKGPEGDGKYVVFIPKTYKGDKEFPLILFLHGSGETGTDGKSQLKAGLAPAIKKMDNFPFIVVFPQSQKRSWLADGPDAKRALSILDEVQKAYKVDSKRIYLTGLSMGGFGTWSLAIAHPGALGRHRPHLRRRRSQKSGQNQDTSLLVLSRRCRHGRQRQTLPRHDRCLDQHRRHAAYTEYQMLGHNCWDRATGPRSFTNGSSSMLEVSGECFLK